jgi:hypothetical protein
VASPHNAVCQRKASKLPLIQIRRITISVTVAKIFNNVMICSLPACKCKQNQELSGTVSISLTISARVITLMHCALLGHAYVEMNTN